MILKTTTTTVRIDNGWELKTLEYWNKQKKKK